MKTVRPKFGELKMQAVFTRKNILAKSLLQFESSE